MSTFTDCADNLTCATLSGSNGIGVGLVSGTPNKIVVSASNVPNNALANSSININGTTIALGASGSITVGAGTVTSVAAGTNLSASGTATDPVLNLTGNITSGLSSVTGLTNVSSNAVTGTNISATNINTTTLTGSVSGSSGRFTTLTASNILSNTVTGSVSGTSGQFVILTGSNIYSNAVTGSVSGTSGQFGSATINTLTSTNISAATVSGTLSGSGALVTNLTASHINHFQEDVRKQFTAGSGINILLGQISVTSVPNSSLANTGSTIGTTAVVLGATVPSLAGLTSVAGTTGSFSILSGTVAITGALGQFNTLTGSNISGTNNLLVGGNVGIGTTTPAESLDVSGTSIFRNTSTFAGSRVYHSASNIVFEYGPGAGTGNSNYYGLFAPSGKAIAIYGNGGNSTIALSGTNVGIGTNNPTYKLDVAGTGRFTSNVEITGTLKGLTQLSSSAISASTYIGLPSSTATITVYEEGASLGSSFTGVNFKGLGITAVANGATADVTVAQAGAAQEGVVSTGTQTFAGNKTFSGDVSIQGNTTIGNATTDTITMTATTMSLGTVLSVDAGTLYIDGTNNRVYAGGTSGSANLHVYGTSSAEAGSVFRVDGNTNGDVATTANIVKIRNTRSNGRTSIEFQNFNGTRAASIGYGNTSINNVYDNIAYVELENVADEFAVINNTNKVYYVDNAGDMWVSGNIYFPNLPVGGSGERLYWDNTTGLLSSETSDIRLKENITSLENSELLNIALNLNPVKFAWKNRINPEDTDVGFIAQEVLPIFNYAVGPEHNGYYTFKIDKLIPVAIGAIKQLKQQNDDLKKTLNEVLARLYALENK